MGTSTLEREIKLRFQSAAEAREAILGDRGDAGPRPPAAGGLPARHRRRTPAGRAVGASGPDGPGPQPPDLQGAGAAVAVEAPRGARDGRRRTARRCSTSSSGSASRSGSATRSTARSSARSTPSSRSTRRPSARSSRSRAARRPSRRLPSALGRSERDYIVDSYRGLYVQHCEADGIAVGDMLFDE